MSADSEKKLILRKRNPVTVLPEDAKILAHPEYRECVGEDAPAGIPCFVALEGSEEKPADEYLNVEFFSHELADVARNPEELLVGFIDKWGLPLSPLHSHPDRRDDLAAFALLENTLQSPFVQVPTNLNEAIATYATQMRAGDQDGGDVLLGERFLEEETRAYVSTIWVGKCVGAKHGSDIESWEEAVLAVKTCYEATTILSFCEAGLSDKEFVDRLVNLYEKPETKPARIDGDEVEMNPIPDSFDKASILVTQYLSRETIMKANDAERSKAIRNLTKSAFVYFDRALTPIKVKHPIGLTIDSEPLRPAEDLLRCDIIQLAAIQFYNELDETPQAYEANRAHWDECFLCGRFFKYTRPYPAKNLGLGVPAVRGGSRFCTREHQVLFSYHRRLDSSDTAKQEIKTEVPTPEKVKEALGVLSTSLGVDDPVDAAIENNLENAEHLVDDIAKIVFESGSVPDMASSQHNISLRKLGRNTEDAEVRKVSSKKIEEIAACIVDGTQGITGMDEELLKAERDLFRTSLLLLRDFFPPKDLMLKSILVLASLSDCTGEYNMYYNPDSIERKSSAYAFMLHQVLRGEKFVQRKNSKEFHWTDSLFRRNYDGAKAAAFRGDPPHKGFNADEDETAGAFIAFNACGFENAVRVILDSKVRLIGLSLLLQRGIISDDEKKAFVSKLQS